MERKSGLPPTARLRLQMQGAKALQKVFNAIARQVKGIRSASQIAPLMASMRIDVAKAVESLYLNTFLTAANHNGSTGLDASVAAEVFAKNEAERTIERIVNWTRDELVRGLALQESLFTDLTKLLSKLFGKARTQRIIVTATTRAESMGIHFVAQTLNLGAPGLLQGVKQELNVGGLLGKALARKPVPTSQLAGELSHPTTIQGHEDRKFMLVWRLDPRCNHCSFCPLIAGTDSLFYSRFVEAPPAHLHCCCNVEIVAAGTKLKKRPSVLQVLAAAREIGLI